MSSILNSAISGLLASQRSLATVSNNISNVNTEGYSRQRVELAPNTPQNVGSGYIGSGVQVGAITRVANEFVISQLRTSTTSTSEADAFLLLASRMDNMLADAETGLAPSLQNFFSALQDVNDLPSSVTARQVFVSEAESLVERFQFLDQRLTSLGDEVRSLLNEDVAKMNNLANSLADINSRIVEAAGLVGGGSPNDLLDQRDKLILELSELVSVNTISQNDGSLNVFIGNGQPLVIGNQASSIGVAEVYDGRYEVTISDTFFSSVISDSITGGSMGAALSFQSDMLEPARNALGRLALGLAETFNQQHQLGISLDGDVDQTFFSVGTPAIAALNGAPALTSASITNVSNLSDSDYQLIYNGGNTYTLTRLSDNTTTAIDTGGTWPYTSAEIDGFTLTLSAAGNAGDQYIIRPTATATADMSVLISDPRKLAMAAPLKAAAVTDATGTSSNIGNAVISEPTTSRTDGVAILAVPLASDINLTYTAPAAAVQNDSSLSGLFTNAVSTVDGEAFSLTVDGVAILNVTQAGGVPETIDATRIDNAITAASGALTAAGITVTGSVAGGDLVFSRIDGVSFDIDITNTFTTAGGFASADFATGTNTINNGAVAVAGNTFTYTVPAPGGTLAYDPATENAGKSFTIPLNADESVTFTISGFPQDGDAFVISNNAGAAGDNRNGLLLGALQNAQTLINGSASYQDAYGQMVAEVGARTRQTEISSQALEVLKQQAFEARESVSGVNLDEEASNMLRFQQSYTAAAQMITVADNLFNSLMDAVR